MVLDFVVVDVDVVVVVVVFQHIQVYIDISFTNFWKQYNMQTISIILIKTDLISQYRSMDVRKIREQKKKDGADDTISKNNSCVLQNLPLLVMKNDHTKWYFSSFWKKKLFK